MLMGNSDRGNFSVALNMVRAENPDNRSPRTHQVTISNGQVTSLANGFQISGNAIITVKGALAGFSGSPVTVQVTGGSAIAFSNIALTFGGCAVINFGDQLFTAWSRSGRTETEKELRAARWPARRRCGGGLTS